MYARRSVKIGKRFALACGLLGSGLVVASAFADVQASFSCSPSCSVAPGVTVTFSSTSTSSSAIRDYAWDLDGDGLYGAADTPAEPDGTGVTSTQRTFAQAGSYTVGLRVRNVEAESAFATAMITVTAPPPEPPRFVPPPFVPPLASANEDGDATANASDVCPGTRAGARVLLRGCSLLDAIVSPAALIESVEDAVRKARKSLGAPTPLRRLTKRPRKLLGLGLKRLQVAGKRLPLSPCGGSGTAGLALRIASKGVKGIGRAVKKSQRAVVLKASRAWRKRFGTEGDSDAFNARFHLLALKREFTKEALEELRAVRKLMRGACKASKGRKRLRARVVSLDSATGLAKLSDATQLAFGAARDVDGLAAGALVRARGTMLKGKLFVAETVQAVGLATKLSACAFTPRIAPVQDFSQGHDKILYYDRRGYLGGFGSYLLERGMGIGAVRGAGCKKDEYALDVFLSYRNTSGVKVKKLIGVLRGFPSGEQPARIPTDVKGKSATLHFELYGLDCQLQGDIPLCDDEQLESKSSVPALIRKQGAWGKAVFNRDYFSVEDGSKTDFDIGTLGYADAPLLPAASVFGVGYGVSADKSLYPQRKFILLGEQFAVHDDVPSQANPGGLLWAYVYGTRNGFPYHYVAKLPDLVTDIVSFCPNVGPSLYRLPWKPGTLEKVTQGNHNGPTHSGGQAFAYDFKMPKFTTGYATRGGVVRLVEENRTKQSNPKQVKYMKEISGGKIDLWVPGNTLIIEHQDGNYSFYTHMPKGGVFPKKGDVVERGDKIITVGSTGNVTGPHLHYHVTTAADTEKEALGGTVLIRFEIAPYFAPNSGIPCQVPKRGEAWTSTNRKPTS